MFVLRIYLHKSPLDRSLASLRVTPLVLRGATAVEVLFIFSLSVIARCGCKANMANKDKMLFSAPLILED